MPKDRPFSRLECFWPLLACKSPGRVERLFRALVMEWAARKSGSSAVVLHIRPFATLAFGEKY